MVLAKILFSNSIFARNMEISHALEMQMEVERKLNEQIEVTYIM